MPTVLAILASDFEEIEFTTPLDLMRRADIEVTTASIDEGIHVTGRSGITLHADTTLASVIGNKFDCIFLPGGPGVKRLRADSRVKEILLKQSAAGRWIAAICAAPLVLNDVDLLVGKRFTSHSSTAEELPKRLETQKVVVDGRLLTSRGAGTAQEFGLALIEHLVSPEAANRVAQAICA